MKVALILALALAVANASFSGSLVQQTKPLLSKARSNMQVAVARSVRARSSAEAGFQSEFINGLIEQAATIMAQIENTVNAGLNIAAGLQEQFQNVVEQLSSLGSDAWTAAQNIVGDFVNNFWTKIFGSNKRASIEITPEMSSIMQLVLTNPVFVNMFRSEPMYLCLKAKGITVDHAHLQNLNQNNQLNAGLLNKPEVRDCLNDVGGLQAILTGNTAKWLVALVQQLNIQNLVHSVLNNLLGAQATQQILAILHSRHRGLFGDLWNTISEGASSAWESISNGVSNQWSQFVDTISDMVSAITGSAMSQFQALQTMASQFISGGVVAAQQLGLQGAQAMITALAPFAADMGNLYQQVVDQLTAVYGQLLNIPNTY